MAVIIDMDIPSNCGMCPFCIYSAEEKRYIGYCNTSDEDYYCKALERFMEYDKVDGGLDILGKPSDCPLKSIDVMIAEIEDKICSFNYFASEVTTRDAILKIIHKYCDKENGNE